MKSESRLHEVREQKHWQIADTLLCSADKTCKAAEDVCLLNLIMAICRTINLFLCPTQDYCPMVIVGPTTCQLGNEQMNGLLPIEFAAQPTGCGEQYSALSKM